MNLNWIRITALTGSAALVLLSAPRVIAHHPDLNPQDSLRITTTGNAHPTRSMTFSAGDFMTGSKGRAKISGIIAGLTSTIATNIAAPKAFHVRCGRSIERLSVTAMTLACRI
jgi:hypothetical protein